MLYVPDREFIARSVSLSSSDESSANTPHSLTDSVFGSPTNKPRMVRTLRKKYCTLKTMILVLGFDNI